MTGHNSTQSLHELFGSFRAEWLEERLFSLFTEPEYFPELMDKRPCVLIGGRGTGKTTALRCMSYEGQLALADGRPERLAQLPFVGIYHRVNTNRVTAFRGNNRSEEDWLRLFCHYTNIELCESLLEAVRWYRETLGFSDNLSRKDCASVAGSIGRTGVSDEDALRGAFEAARDELELHINNTSSKQPTLSLLGRPLERLIEAILGMPPFAGKTFYFIIDEYENFLDYQQAVFNTLIKHAASGYVFKIGARELGWRVKSTLNSTEHLIHPADYEYIHIETRLGDTFTSFAKRVCEARLMKWYELSGQEKVSLNELLPNLSAEEESILLGVGGRLNPLMQHLREMEPEAKLLADISPHKMYVFYLLSGFEITRTISDLIQFSKGSEVQKNRYHNYSYAALFTIAPKASDISKYYCGLDTFVSLSRNNIRYFLHLISESIIRQMSTDGIGIRISVENQTKAARQVGLSYLTELEGVTVHGVQLVKLILGLGRLFQILAENPTGGAPECNQFHVKASNGSSAEDQMAVVELLRHAVMNLALVRTAGTKLAAATDIKDWDYSPHPIFSPYFNFSHRRKRKIRFSEQHILDLISKPNEAIRRLLKDRAYLVEQVMPVQLRLFDEYFAGSNANG